MWKRLFAASLTFGVAAAAPPAHAQVTCDAHDNVSDRLKAKFGENVVGRGLSSETALYEIWRSPDSGSWTVVLLKADGVACIMASGFAWTDAPTPPVGEAS